MLELLVVISIIGLLVAIGTVAFSTVQKKGKDSKVRGDMQQVQKAFEQYYASNNANYADCATMAASSAVLPGGMPVDPAGSAYSCEADTTGYCVCGALDSGGNATAPSDGATTCNFASSSQTHFCVQNLQ